MVISTFVHILKFHLVMMNPQVWWLYIGFGCLRITFHISLFASFLPLARPLAAHDGHPNPSDQHNQADNSNNDVDQHGPIQPSVFFTHSSNIISY